MFPKIVQSVVHDRKTDTLQLTFVGALILGCAAALGLTFVGPLVFRIVFPAAYASLVPLLPWFAWSMVPLSLGICLAYVLAAQKAGEIDELARQVRFRLDVNGVHVAVYVADFTYVRDGERITEDVKGAITPVYRLKKKLMKACHGIEILET